MLFAGNNSRSSPVSRIPMSSHATFVPSYSVRFRLPSARRFACMREMLQRHQDLTLLCPRVGVSITSRQQWQHKRTMIDRFKLRLRWPGSVSSQCFPIRSVALRATFLESLRSSGIHVITHGCRVLVFVKGILSTHEGSWVTTPVP